MTLFHKRKILFICNSLIIKAGVESRTLEQMVYFRKQGYFPEVCVLREKGSIALWYESHGFKVHFIQVYRSKMAHINPLQLLYLAWFILSRRFGVVICVQHPSHYFGRIACFPPLRRKIIIMERSAIEGRNRLKLIMDYLFSLWTTKIVCVGNHIKSFFLLYTPIPSEKIVTIENGVLCPDNPEKPSYTAKECQGRFVFGTVGMLIPSKRQEILIQSFAMVLQTVPDCMLILVGTGPDETKLKQLCKKLDIENKVIFTGQQFEPGRFLSMFDAFVFPSVSEGFGTALYEAMICSLPVICSRVSPMTDYLVDYKSGLFFEPDNVEELADRMKILIHDKAVRKKIAFNGYTLAYENFDFYGQIEKLHRLIR